MCSLAHECGVDPVEDAKYNVNPTLINRRGIYKDVFGSGKGREWSDYQLRCNYPIAMTVAPELFDPQHAMSALKIYDKVLRSPLGTKTLDPADMQYRPYYDNANDGDDPSIAKGLNYHNGPEWGWPLGYFLRAYFYFDTPVGGGKQVSDDSARQPRKQPDHDAGPHGDPTLPSHAATSRSPPHPRRPVAWDPRAHEQRRRILPRFVQHAGVEREYYPRLPGGGA